MRFVTRVLLLQLAAVAAVVAVCAAVFTALGVQQLRTTAEASAMAIAQTVASDDDVRALVANWSADPGTPDAADLRGGELEQIAGEVTARTGSLFVVITDDHGIRLAHPDQSALGVEVSTSYQDALAGRETSSWERGTLGDSARAKVPVYPPGGGDPVGEVSVGFESGSVFSDLPTVLAGIALAAALALLVGALGTLLLRRRWERLTLGLQPEELVTLVQNQSAVLDGVDDGVVALDTDGVVRVCNRRADELLGVRDAVGRSLDDLDLADPLRRALDTGADGVIRGDRVLFLDRRPVRHDGRYLGDVVVVRDRTDLEQLTERLESVRVMTGALRVQRHEFANRLHVAAGLIDAGRTADARVFLDELEARGPVDFAVPGLECVADEFLQSFLGAKGIETGERGVQLRIGDDTVLHGRLDAAEDAAAVIGNLIDNAATAALAASRTPHWVEVDLFDQADELVVTISDSGDGVTGGLDVFAPRGADDAVAPDAVHGRGIGLPLSRELARRRDGDVWVVDTGGEGRGAVFAMRMRGVMTSRAGAR